MFRLKITPPEVSAGWHQHPEHVRRALGVFNDVLDDHDDTILFVASSRGTVSAANGKLACQAKRLAGRLAELMISHTTYSPCEGILKKGQVRCTGEDVCEVCHTFYENAATLRDAGYQVEITHT